TVDRITKVVAGQTPEVTETLARLYRRITTGGVFIARNIRTAEAAKVIENAQRDINIAFINEVTTIFQKMGLSIHDVLEAARTKWNFLDFTPGLVGGHCIGVDPYYLTHKAAISGYIPQVILSGRSINDGMGKFIVSRVIKTLIKGGFSVKANGIIILGFTFKEDVPDTRNTRVIDIINELQDYEMDVQIHDPQASKEEVKNEYGLELKSSAQLTPGCAVILAVPHHEYRNSGWDLIKGLLKDNKGVVFDVGGVLDRATIPEGVQLERL
ncbi:MAG: nucleotide sugar dehydrogenase, partial [Proteobacteria bacterium]|nr:nucleotide sugar dehydrogenase [Pseudomonadota bacterium]